MPKMSAMGRCGHPKCGRYGTWNCGLRKLLTRQVHTSMLLARLRG